MCANGYRVKGGFACVCESCAFLRVVVIWRLLIVSDDRCLAPLGTEKAYKLFNINFWPPTQNPPSWAPRKKLMCLISWERTPKRDPHKLFRGDFWVKKGVPKGPLSATKSLVYFLLFLPLSTLGLWFEQERSIKINSWSPGGGRGLPREGVVVEKLFPSNVCFPWLRGEETWDVLGIWLGCAFMLKGWKKTPPPRFQPY